MTQNGQKPSAKRGPPTYRFSSETHERRRVAGFILAMCGSVSFSALAQEYGEDAGVAATLEEPESCPPPDGTRPDPALIVTDEFVLRRFSLRRVLRTLQRRAHVRGQGATALYQQLWDSLDTQENAKFEGSHCDDTQPPSIGGFGVDCPRKEARLKDTESDTFVPVALVNRFDLHAEDGSDCGEYRIVYAMHPFSPSNRNFVNLEFVLPNPTPQLGLEGCRPVVAFWKDLRRVDIDTGRGRRQLRRKLSSFYFRGHGGAGAVVTPRNLGMEEVLECSEGPPETVSGRGQIRTNMFVDAVELTDTWQLRQFALEKICSNDRCRLAFRPAPVGDNPFPGLFDASLGLAGTDEFREEFIGKIEGLASDDFNRIRLRMDPSFNAGQSTSTAFNDHLVTPVLDGLSNGEAQIVDAIREEISRLELVDITVVDVLERANTQTCAGCHQSSVGQPLSGGGTLGPGWPATRLPTVTSSGGFVHVNEEGLLSPALWCSFLPFRRRLLDEL